LNWEITKIANEILIGEKHLEACNLVDEFRLSLSGNERSEIINQVLSDVPSRINNMLLPRSYKAGDFDTTSLPNILINTIPDEEKDQIGKRVQKESAIFGPARFRNLLTALRAADSDAFINNRFIQLMKFVFMSTGMDEPFYQSPSGTIDQRYSTLFTKTILTLLNAAFKSWEEEWEDHVAYYDGGRPMMEADVMEEVVVYLAGDPYVRTLLVKKYSSLSKNAMVTLARGGSYPLWPAVNYQDPTISGGGSVKFTNFLATQNDSPVIRWMQKAWSEELRELTKLGLGKLAKWYVHVSKSNLPIVEDGPLGIKFNYVSRNEGLGVANRLVFVEAITGYTRGHGGLANKDNLAGADELLFHKFGPSETEYPAAIKERYPDLSELFDYIVRQDWIRYEDGHWTPLCADNLVNIWTITAEELAKNGLPNYGEWLSALLSNMTSQSSGMPEGVELKFRYNDEDISFTTKAKNLTLLGLGFEKMITRAWDDLVMFVSNRSVPARGVRSVWMISLVIYIWETIFFPGFMDIMIDDIHFSGGKGQGSTLADHRLGSTIEIWKAREDFSKFDSTLKRANFRKFQIKGVLRGLEQAGRKDETFGPPELNFGTYGEIFTDIQEFLTNAPFLIEDNRGNQEVVRTNQMNSGELGTIIGDTQMNLAQHMDTKRVVNACVSLYPEKRRAYERLARLLQGEEFFQVMGDDSVTGYAIAEGLDIDATVVETFAHLRSFISDLNGLEENEQKFGFSRMVYEYLKKMFIANWLIPRKWQIQPFEKENAPTDNIFNIRKEIYDLNAEMVARGSDDRKTWRYSFWLSCIISTISWVEKSEAKISVKNGKIERDRKRIQIPSRFEFLPPPYGTGRVPGSCGGESMKSLFTFFWPPWKWLIWDEARYVMKVLDSDIPSDMAKKILSDEKQLPGVKDVRTAQSEHASVRMTDAIKAHGELMSKRIPIDIVSKKKLGYWQMAERGAVKAIKANQGYRKLAQASNRTMGRSIQEGMKEYEQFYRKSKLIRVTMTALQIDYCYWWQPIGRLFIREDQMPLMPEILEISSRCGRDIVIMRESIAGEKTYHIDDILRMITKRTTDSGAPRPSFDDFPLGRMMSLRVLEPIPLAMSACPIVGLSEDLQRICCIYGASTQSDAGAFRVVTALQRMMRDNLAPRDLTAEVIMDVISPREISVDDKVLILQVMGFDPRKATTAVNEIVNDMTRLGISSLKNYSTRGAFTVYLDFTDSGYQRVVKLGNSIDPRLTNMARGLAYLYSVYRPEGTGYQIEINFRAEAIKVLNDMNQRNGYPEYLSNDVVEDARIL
jgi:hypothetical protein